MPIYEFYCSRCNTIYKFFSRSVNTEKIPYCPNCKDVQLSRRMSPFAIGHSGDDQTEDEDLPISESKMEEAMHFLEREAGNIDENNPRQMANLMRKFNKTTGLQMGSAMEEAIRRLEKGEDMESIEEDLGDALQDDDVFMAAQKGLRKSSKPRVDERLYDL